MNPRVKEMWLKALRRRKDPYEQGTGLLRSGSGGLSKFCCLGVLCDLHSKDTGAGAWSQFSGSWDYVVAAVPFQRQSIVLPWAVVEWAGLPGEAPKIDGAPLTEWNDSRGKSFRQIADLIEEHL